MIIVMIHVHTSRDMQSVVAVIELIYVILSGAYYCVFQMVCKGR